MKYNLSHKILKFIGTIAVYLMAKPISICSQSITLYRQVDVKEEAFELSVLECTNTNSLPEQFIQQISCGNFTADCAQFYDMDNCDGNSVEIRRESVKNLPWRLDRVKSIGPCEPEGLEIVERIKGNHTTFTIFDFNTGQPISDVIELFEHADFKGVHAVLEIHNGCISFPRKIKNRVSSVRFPSEICLELHQLSDCSGRSVRIRRKQKNPRSINLAGWGFDDIASSASLCGCPCKNSTKTPTPTYCEHAILYDEQDLKGNFKSVTVSKCVDFDDEWEGAAESLRLLSDCVILYRHFGCHRREIALELTKSSNETQRDFNLSELNIDGQIRSIGPCYMPSKSPLKAIYMALIMFITGITIAGIVNGYVRRREKRESAVDLSKK